MVARQDLTVAARNINLQGKFQADRDIALKAQESLKISDLANVVSTISAGRDLLLQGSNAVDISALQNFESVFFSGQKTFGNTVFRSDNPIIGEPRIYANGNFSIEKLDGTSLGIFSQVVNGGVILAIGNVSLGDYKGGSLSILAGGSVTIGNVEIRRTADVDKSINPNNQTLFNATKRYADLASFNLTDYQAIKNSDGSVKEIVPVQTAIAIDGSIKPTLDVRAGVDWVQLGGLPTSPIVTGTVKPDPIYTNPAVRADITVNGNITVSQPDGLVFLTNQFSPNSLSGTISTQGINTSTGVSESNGGAISVYGRGDIVLNDANWNSSSSLQFNASSLDPNVTLQYGKSGDGGAISLVSSAGNITLNNSRLSAFSYSDIISDKTNPVLAKSANGGFITLSANSGKVTLSNSILESYSEARRLIDQGTNSFSLDLTGNNVTGNGGVISLISNFGDVSISKTTLSSNTLIQSFLEGNGGEISLASSFGNVLIENSRLNSSSRASRVSSNGGVISLASKSGNITLESSNVSTGNSQNAGRISLATDLGNIVLHSSELDSSSRTRAENAKNAGIISLSTNFGNITLNTVTLNSYSSSSTGTSGGGATIFLGANSGDITLNNTKFNAYSYSENFGTKTSNGGDIFIYAPNGSILSSIASSLLAFTFALRFEDLNSLSGAGGNVTLTAKNQIGNLEVFTQASNGQAGQVKLIGLGNLSINNLQISTSKSVQIPSPDNPTFLINFDTGTLGKSGNVEISSIGSLTIAQTVINSTTQGSDPAGNISFTSPTAIAFQNSQILSNTSNIGNAGNILINAGQGIAIANNSKIAATTNGQMENAGKAGDIILNTLSVNIRDGSQVLAETNSSGSGGNITINAPNSVSLTREQDAFPVLSVQTTNAGKAGNILINTNILNLSDQAKITATATNTATNLEGGGSITLNASTMNLFGIVGVFAETQGNSPAGTLLLNPYNNQLNLKLVLTPNSQISASTSGTGNGGSIFLTAPESIDISGQGKLAVETSSAGNAGNISFSTKQLTLTDGILISASTSGSGKAGDVSIKANNFSISNGAKIQTTTSGIGDSGSINIIVDDNFSLSGNNTGLFANTEANSTGKGGSILIAPPLVSITNGAVISVNSLGKGNGGSLDIVADKFIFANNAALFANTASGEGGNINLKITDIFFPRNNSNITATAGGTGNGGNISLSSLFMIAVPSENSDLFANAFFGKGGQIDITTNGLFGLEFRSRQTPFSDITASSEFGIQGNVSITTPGVDPSKGLSNLPSDTSDASKLVAEKCLADRQGSSFVITGRGGVPASPFETISAVNIPDHLGSISNQTASNSSNVITSNPSDRLSNHIPDRIVEAQGWIINSQGQISLIAEVAATPAPVWSNQPKCVSISNKQLAIH